MRIVTMATESYSNWLYHFLSSINHKTTVYAINFSSKTLKQFKKEFKNVEFIKYNKDVEPKDKHNPLGKVFLVTHLKGQFVKDAFYRYNEDIVWVDCTELIRSDISELEGTFRFKRGSNGKTKTYAAIFGMADKDVIDEYAGSFENNKDWFSDQISLGKLDIEERDKGDWLDFFYSEKAKSWSDRGKNGTGTLDKDDYDYTERKYIDDLNKRIDNYEYKFDQFMEKIKKPKIMIFTDDGVWCYAISVRKIVSMLNEYYDFTVIGNVKRQYDEIMNWDGEFVWARCGSFRTGELTRIRPDLKVRMFSSVTTGGECLMNRVDKNIQSNYTEAGMVVQNSQGVTIVKANLSKLDREMPIFILPNGCDVEKFNPVDKSNRFIVGWNGRITDNTIKNVKGYYYFDLAKRIMNLETSELDGIKKLPFNEMPSFYNGISILLLPSHAEGCSNTINEALASGVPVLAYKTGWHGEVMKEIDDGVIWIERNIDDITNKIKYIKQNYGFMQKLSKNARRFAEDHSWEKVAIDYKRVFDKMLKITSEIPKKKIIPIVKVQKNVSAKSKDRVDKKYIKVRAIKRCNLGKIERNGATLWFEIDMIRTVPYYDRCKNIIDEHVEQRFIEIVN